MIVGKLCYMFEVFVAHTSILLITAISFERYYAITQPLHAKQELTKGRAVNIIVVIWTLALATARYEKIHIANGSN